MKITEKSTPRTEMCKNQVAEILTNNREITLRWKIYFTEVLNRNHSSDGKCKAGVKHTVELLVQESTIDEMKESIRTNNNYEVSAPDGV